jgi:muramoyltetrapeptide carboxypeptidase
MSQAPAAHRLAAPIRPARLRPGDTVAVCAPAGPVTPERLKAGLAILEARYRVVMAPEVFARKGYLAGSDDRRADELNRYLREGDVRAIFLTRGGYGLMRILDRLDAAALRADPIPIVGFSDATALLAWARTCAGVGGVHGPVVAQLGKLDHPDIAWLFRLLEDPKAPGQLPWTLTPWGAPPRAALSGPLVGGNLCLLSHLVGTPYQIDVRDALVFIEEIGEPPYRVDRYLTHLHLAGALEGAKAVLAGDFHGCEEPEGGYEGSPGPVELVGARMRDFGIPVIAGLPLGHGPRNAALPFAAACTVDPSGHLSLDEPAVS